MRSRLCKIPQCNRCLKSAWQSWPHDHPRVFYCRIIISYIYFRRRKKIGSKKSILNFQNWSSLLFFFQNSDILMGMKGNPYSKCMCKKCMCKKVKFTIGNPIVTHIFESRAKFGNYCENMTFQKKHFNFSKDKIDVFASIFFLRRK